MVMGMGLEIYDEKGRLIIGEDTIIPRYLGKFDLPLSQYGSLIIPEISYGGEIVCHFWIRYRSIFSNSFHKMGPNERTSYSVSGTTLNYRCDYNVYRWEQNGGGGGQTQTNDSFSNHVVVWAV
ncbi:hypothetical protein GWJ01_12060 [Proteus sp. G2618]|nr:hypothetical protein CRN77_14520 [Proteus vulgaris]NBN71833.1 hypothetical protein [Proteus sp. G2618]